MSPTEWVEIVRRINANWPHQVIPAPSLAKWYDDLKDLDVDPVLAAMEALYRDGREFPPNGAQIRSKVMELTIDAPEFGEAWRLILRAIRHWGYLREPEALAWLKDKHPLLRDLAQQMGWGQLCHSTEPDVIHGQARRVWEGLCRRRTREATYHGLPDADLAALERVNGQPATIAGAIAQITGAES